MKKRIKLFNKGFTLIELLAVIVVLAIILIIAIPRIMNVIEESQKEALKLSAKNIEKSARDRLHMNTDYPKEDVNYLIIDGEFVGESIPLSGTLPKNGTIFVRSDGDVGLALSDGKFCLIKNVSDDEMIVTKDIDNCVLVVETPSYCFDYWEVSDTEIEIIGYNRYDCPLDVIIPQKISGKTVVQIGEEAFNNQVYIYKYKGDEKIVTYNGQVGLNKYDLLAIPSYQGLPQYHERNNRSITSVVIPNTVKYIEDGSFRYNLLKSITIPDSVEVIGKHAFEYNELENIDIASSVTDIRVGAFNDNQLSNDQAFIYARNPDGSINNNKLISYGGSNKNTVTIPSSVKVIGEYAFYTSTFNSIVIPNTVETIEDYAFYKNNIKTIQIPNDIELAEDAISYPFYLSYNNYYGKIEGTYSASCQDCTWKYSTLGAPSIPTSCFNTSYYGPSEISIDEYDRRCPKDVVIPATIGGNTVVFIEPYAFAYSDLISVVLPNTIREIVEYAFYDNQLTSVTIPNSVTTIGEGVFSYNQLSSVTLNNGIITIGSNAFVSNQLTSITIPSTLKKIGSFAFESNKLTSVTIPASVIEIGNGVFNDNLFPDSTAFIYKRNLDGSMDNTKIISYAGIKKENVIIPNNVTTVDAYAFSYVQLKSITIPNSVTTIGKYAFASNQLTSVVLPNYLTEINEEVFSRNQLTNITIPNSVTTIGIDAFYLNKLTSVTIPNSVTTIGRGAFSWNQLTSVTIPNSVTTIGEDAFSYNQLISITLNNGIITIGRNVFFANQLISVTIGTGVNMENNSISSTFYNAYNPNKLAGTYTAPSQKGTWTKQP